MSVGSDEKAIPGTSVKDASQKIDASVVLNQLRGSSLHDTMEHQSSVNNKNAETISAPADVTPGNEIPPDSDEIRRKLDDEDADKKIREQLVNARVWEEKQNAIERERARQRKEIEREIEDETRNEAARRWKRNAGIGAAIILIVIVAAVFTFSVQPNLPAAGDSFPYVSSYNVRIPQAEQVEFAGIPVTVSGTGDKVIVSISSGLGTEISVGEKITLSSPKRMVIRIFGLTLFESDYQIVATFRGYVPSTNQNDFAVSVMTARSVPEWAVGVIMPKGVDATPVSGE